LVKNDLRRTGIAAVPEVPWGSHLCLFYGNQEDLIQVLVPFLTAGLQDNELCLVLTSERLPAARLLDALRGHRPDVDGDVQRGALSMVPVDECYAPAGSFDRARTLKFWREKVEAATGKGFAGLRGSGDGAWLKPDDSLEFSELEHDLELMMSSLPMIVLCPYLSSTKTAGEVLDVARHHDIVLAKRDGKWDILETAGSGETKLQLNASRAQAHRQLLDETSELESLRHRLDGETRARLRAEHVLRESEARFSRSFAASPIITLITRRDDGRIIEANEAFTQVTGYERAEVVGRTPVEIGLWLEPHARATAMEIAEAEGGLKGFEFQGRTKGGDHLDLLLFAQPIEVQGERCFIGGAIDLTAAKKAERELRNKQWLLSESERLSHTGSWERNEQGDFVWSDEMYRIHGQDARSFKPSRENCIALIHPDDREAARAALDKADTDGSPHAIEYRIVPPEGQVRHLRSVAYSAVRAPGQSLHVVGYVTDVTELRHAERASRDALDRLKKLSRKLVELQESERLRLSRELHDRIGQNLTALSINIDMIRRKLGADVSKDLLGRVEDSSLLLDATANAVTDILAELRPAALDDLGVLPALEWYGRQFAQRTGIRVAVQGENNNAGLSQEQRTALFRIAQEALTNVAKHAAAKQVLIGLERSGSAFVLTIADDGIGASPAIESGGAGLGLVTMRERATAVGGEFELRSASGGGTVVEVRIPVEAPSESQP
jgi:two-component system, NarL family, sensor histidine kinase UhpB